MSERVTKELLKAEGHKEGRSDQEITNEVSDILNIEGIYKKLDILFSYSTEADKEDYIFRLRYILNDFLDDFRNNFLESLEGMTQITKKDVDNIKAVVERYKDWSNDDLSELVRQINIMLERIRNMVDIDFVESSDFVVQYKKERGIKRNLTEAGVGADKETRDRISEFYDNKKRELHENFSFENAHYGKKTLDEVVALLENNLEKLEKMRELDLSFLPFSLHEIFTLSSDIDLNYKREVDKVRYKIEGALEILRQISA